MVVKCIQFVASLLKYKSNCLLLISDAVAHSKTKFLLLHLLLKYERDTGSGFKGLPLPKVKGLKFEMVCDVKVPERVSVPLALPCSSVH